MKSIDLSLDVTEAAGIGEPACIMVTVHLPDPHAVGPQPIVCFAKPGGGYARTYFTTELPGPGQGAQAPWHAERGWIFVSVDHLGVGESSMHAHESLQPATLAAGAQAAEAEVLRRLRAGELQADFPAVRDPVVIGAGQSMGAFMMIVQQGSYECYDGLAVLGYSAVHTRMDTPSDSGAKPFSPPWMAGGGNPDAVKQQEVDETAELAWGFFYDDMDPQFVWDEMSDFPTRHGKLARWASGTWPLSVVSGSLTPGVVAPFAAAVRSPVLLAMAERDVVVEPRTEARAYPLSRSVDLFICPRMGHMHNFAGTRTVFWRRLEMWAETVRDLKNAQLDAV